jgi:hypothetical protein
MADQMMLFPGDFQAEMYPWPGWKYKDITAGEKIEPADQNLFEVEMETEDLFITLMSKIQTGKENSEQPLPRYYAILLTELEKMYAFWLIYLFPNEEVIEPQEGEDEQD